MAIYGGFAAVYDALMDPPYDEWAQYVSALWAKFGEKPKLALDIACGTGNMTARFAAQGYDMIGVDSAADMLAAARAKNSEILYICQDMRELELYGTVDAAACLCDGMNYLESYDDLVQVMRLMRNYLNPGGVFVFDMNTEHYFADILGDSTFAEAGETVAYIWENSYDCESRVNEYAVTFFTEDENGLYKRFEEVHRETAFAESDVRKAAAKSGLTVCAVYDELTFDGPQDTSERIFYILRREQ